MSTEEAPAQLLPDDASGYIVSGIVTSMVVLLLVGAATGIAARLLGRRGSWPAAGVLGILGFIAGPVGLLLVSSLAGGFLAGNTFTARRRAPSAEGGDRQPRNALRS